jgi:hypothetical protein
LPREPSYRRRVPRGSRSRSPAHPRPAAWSPGKPRARPDRDQRSWPRSTRTSSSSWPPVRATIYDDDGRRVMLTDWRFAGDKHVLLYDGPAELIRRSRVRAPSLPLPQKALVVDDGHSVRPRRRALRLHGRALRAGPKTARCLAVKLDRGLSLDTAYPRTRGATPPPLAALVMSHKVRLRRYRPCQYVAKM